MPKLETKFQVFVGMLQDPIQYPNSPFTNWTEITDRLLDSGLEISKGLSSKTSLFDFESQNITLTLWGNYGYGIAPSAFTIRPYSPVKIETNWTTKNIPKVIFRGFVAPDGITVDEEFVDFPITKLLVLSYTGSLKDVKLGSCDMTYRFTEHGATNTDPNEIAALYIKGGAWDVPDVTNPERPSVEAEVALTPAQFFTPNFLVPGDRFIFERRFIFDSRMLTDELSQHIGWTPRAPTWHSYTYNHNEDCAIRYLEFQEGFSLILYTTPPVTLTELLTHLCTRMSIHYFHFPYYNSLWPFWRHTHSDPATPIPNLVLPGQIGIDVGRCWHYRYLHVNSKDWLIVWNTQFDVRIFEVQNYSNCIERGSYSVYPTLNEEQAYDGEIHRMILCSSAFADVFSVVRQEYPFSRLVPIKRSPDRLTGNIDTTGSLHPEWQAWCNALLVHDNRYIIFGWVNASKWKILLPSGSAHSWETITNFELCYLDTLELEFLTPPCPISVGTYSEDLYSALRVSTNCRQHESPGYPNETDTYYIPQRFIGSDIRTEFWDATKWEYDPQVFDTDPMTSDPGATWTDGVRVNGQPSIVESTQITQLIIGSPGEAVYVREVNDLTLFGDLALDKIQFSFEDMSCSDLLKLICILTDSIPVFEHNEQDWIDLTLVPRQVASATIREISVKDLQCPLSREQWQYLSVDVVPSVDIPGLVLSDAHKRAINAYFQKQYYLMRHELTTAKVDFIDDERELTPQWWLPDLRIGETLQVVELNGKHRDLGMVEGIKLTDYHVQILARRRF